MLDEKENINNSFEKAYIPLLCLRHFGCEQMFQRSRLMSYYPRCCPGTG